MWDDHSNSMVDKYPICRRNKKNMCYNHQKASSYLTKLWRNNFGDLPIVEHGDFPVHHVK